MTTRTLTVGCIRMRTIFTGKTCRSSGDSCWRLDPRSGCRRHNRPSRCRRRNSRCGDPDRGRRCGYRGRCGDSGDRSCRLRGRRFTRRRTPQHAQKRDSQQQEFRLSSHTQQASRREKALPKQGNSLTGLASRTTFRVTRIRPIL